MRKFLFVVCLISIFSICNVQAQRGCCSHHGGVSGLCRNGKQVCNDGTTSPSCTCSGKTESTTGSSRNYVKTIYGCTDSNAINYNANANKDDGSCISKVYGCMSQDALNYNSNANVDDGSCIEKVYGCTDKGAINYNESANVSDKSCQFKKTTITYKKIKYKTKYKYKWFYNEGYVLQKGKKGKRKITREIIVDEEGNTLNSKIIKKEVIKKPVTKIVVTKKKS